MQQLLSDFDSTGAGPVVAWRGGTGTIFIGEGTAGEADVFDGATVDVQVARYVAGPWIDLPGIAATSKGVHNVTLRPCFLRAYAAGGGVNQLINASIDEVSGEPEGKL